MNTASVVLSRSEREEGKRAKKIPNAKWAGKGLRKRC